MVKSWLYPRAPATDGERLESDNRTKVTINVNEESKSDILKVLLKRITLFLFRVRKIINNENGIEE